MKNSLPPILKKFIQKYDIDSLDNSDPEVIDLICRYAGEFLVKYYRADVRGVESIPSGPALYVGNHSSGMASPDSFLFGNAVYKAHGLDAVPYGLGHKVVISLPLIHQVLMPLGAVRASHENAGTLFRRGKKVLVYPGGDVEAMRPYRKRNKIVFDGRRGYIRLALRERVPIIPVVSAGSHETLFIIDDMRWLARLLSLEKLFRLKVWPLTLSIPWGVTIGPPPLYIPVPVKILIEISEPIMFERDGPEAAGDEDYVMECAALVETGMQKTLDRLTAERRKK